jgi:hypothetical protein
MAKQMGNKLKPEAKSSSKRSWVTNVTVWAWTGVFVLAVFEALIANNQASSGQRSAALQQQQADLSDQIDNLERRIAETGSLQNIRQRATDQLGLQPVDKNVIYLAWPTPLEEKR